MAKRIRRLNRQTPRTVFLKRGTSLFTGEAYIEKGYQICLLLSIYNPLQTPFVTLQVISSYSSAPPVRERATASGEES